MRGNGCAAWRYSAWILPLERPMHTNPRRKYLRHTVQVPLDVRPVTGAARMNAHGVNVSYGGLAFLSSTCPALGAVLHLRIPTVEPVFEADVRVTWCRPEAEKFLVGVEFLDAAAAFQSRMVEQVCAIENYRQEVQQQEGRTLTTQEAAAEWITKYGGRFPDTDVESSDDNAA